MYTQCPDCSTVFRVNADILRAAQGHVRCGICSCSFNAIDNLSEAAVPRAVDGPPEEDTITVEEIPGTEIIELSGTPDPGADEASGDSDGPDAGEAEPGTPEQEPIDSIPDAALEFHGSAEDLERLFVQGNPIDAGRVTAVEDFARAIGVSSSDLGGIEVREHGFALPAAPGTPFDPGNPSHVAAFLAGSSAEPEAAAGEDLDRTDEYPVLVVGDYEARRTGDDDGAAVSAGAEVDADVDATVAEPAAELPAGEDTPPQTGEAALPVDEPSTGTGAAQDEVPLLIIPDELRRGPSTSPADDFAAPLGLDEPSPYRWPLVAAALVLLAALGAQAVHHWRADLVQQPAAGPWMLRAYGALGLALDPPVDLAAFELRQLGAASDPGQAGRIKVRASIVNRAPFAQPYPLLRLTLQDRFGSTIGARNLVPQEYLPGAATDASGLLGPSQRADAEVVFVDPGRDAVGFELDVCVESASGLRCSTDLPRHAP